MARSRAKDYDDKRLIILHRSAQLIAESGYVGTSMNTIADACRVSKALLYQSSSLPSRRPTARRQIPRRG
jgi:AcrR family transcriptional regulator